MAGEAAQKGMLKNFEGLFGGQYLERGREYYREDAVKTVLREGNLVTARVQGNELYRVSIDLKTREMECSCPCDLNCKHMAAVLYALRANKADETGKLFAPLKNKSREELEEIIRKLVMENPEQAIFINPDKTALEKEIRRLWLTDDEYGFEMKSRRLLELVSKTEKPLELQMKLFRKLFDIYDHNGGPGLMEGAMFKLLGEMRRELKKPENKAQKAKVLKDIKNLVNDYDWFLDAVE